MRGTQSVLLTRCRLVQDVPLDLFDHKRQIGPGESQIGRYDTVMFDIRGDVLVVGIGTGERGILGMGERIVPVELFLVGVGCPAILGSPWGVWHIQRSPGARDLVAIALDDLVAGDKVGIRSLLQEIVFEFEVADSVPYGHKLSVKPVAKGAEVIKNGEVIGVASQSIKKGEHVHIHNIVSMYVPPPKAKAQKTGRKS